MNEYEEDVLEIANYEYDDEELEDDAEEMWSPLLFIFSCLSVSFQSLLL